MRERLQKQRHKFGKDFPRASGTHPRPTAEVPAPDRLGGERRFLESHPRQCFESFRIVASPRENKTAGRRVEPRRMLEQPPIMIRDKPQAMRDIAAKAACPRVAAK